VPRYTPRVSPNSRVGWVVLGRSERHRWGGDLRRFHIFGALANRSGAVSEALWDRGAAARGIRRAVGLPVPWRRRPYLATAELLTVDAIPVVRRRSVPSAIDVHDHPVIQAAALGRPFPAAQAAELKKRFALNLDLFPVRLAPSASFALLAGLDKTTVIVAPNGSDTAHVRPAGFPSRPSLGMVSAAASNRGIEALVEAARMMRSNVPDLGLHLWLVSTDRVGSLYVDELRTTLAADPWIEIESIPYAELGPALARATVMVVPHPANEYMDVAVPVKLLDSMAAGRPVVVTPRLEAERIVRAADCGRVAEGDRSEDLAAAILPILEDPALARRLGANARAAAERDYDWRVIGDRVADEIFRRLNIEIPALAASATAMDERSADQAQVPEGGPGR
jgi:glycosyltransferase involved in cell wall biosynthesis